jgi:hypothetical protein
MTATPSATEVISTLDRAVALVIADGDEAARLAAVALRTAEARADGDLQCLSLSVLALHAFREGQPDSGAAHLASARERLGGMAPSPRARQFMEHVQAQWFRSQGRLAEAEQLLGPLHAAADRRPPPTPT